ncbi:lipopolysaccharide-responsive and beige-like anchor protein, partial [Tachysurus ichikawai]
FVTPRAILTGHDCEVTCASVCAELGVVISGSKDGLCLLHSVSGELLRVFESTERPMLMQASAEGHCVIYYSSGHVCVYSINGKLLCDTHIEDNIKTLAQKRQIREGKRDEKRPALCLLSLGRRLCLVLHTHRGSEM